MHVPAGMYGQHGLIFAPRCMAVIAEGLNDLGDSVRIMVGRLLASTPNS